MDSERLEVQRRARRSALLGMLALTALACQSQVALGQARGTPPSAQIVTSSMPAPAPLPIDEITAQSTVRAAGGDASEALPNLLDEVLASSLESDEDIAEAGDKRRAPYRRTRIEDASHRSLSAFHAALRRAASGRGQARIVFYGASHVAGEMFTGPLRQRLQLRFGEAGPGFVAPAKPWTWYHHSGINIDESRGFKALRVKTNATTSGLFGLAGVALDARPGRPARSIVETLSQNGLEGGVSQFALYYLRQPRGGSLSVFLDGRHRQDISTAAPQTGTGYARFEAEDTHHRFELRTTGDGPVRVFGVALERSEPGVILDTLGLPGARARDHLCWDEAVYREHLASRMPDLVALAYGTNESGDDGVPISAYEAGLRRVIDRIRDVVPYASCLLIGPSDRPRRNPNGGYGPRPLTTAIIETQRRVATEAGCGFFDLRGFMGGEMSMVRWAKASPPLGAPDHVHFTNAGYERLAAVLYDALLEGFDDRRPQSGALAASPGSAESASAQELSPLAR